MLFSSITFLYYFLPCVLILYFAVPKCLKNAVLLLSSLFFYAWGEPKYVILMVLSIFMAYIFGLIIEKYRGQYWSKVAMIISVIISLSSLVYFKYSAFFIANFNKATGLNVSLLNIALPIGISFYTFQIVSYTIDVYRGDVKARKNPIGLAAYVAMFPQLIAGPIVRYSDIEKQLDDRSFDIDKVAEGIRRFVIGLSKKILIANVLGELCENFKASESISVLFVWLYAISYMLHVYFDFSGYSDMAIGLGKIFGFDFLENFNYPFISKSITEFWRRWHMSLGTWFRDYVYIPLGGNRVSKFRHVFNILIVWMLTGFWHGADWNFIVWGLFFAVFLTIEKFFLSGFLKKRKVVGHVYVIILCLVSFVIFDASDMSVAISNIKGMFGLGNIPLASAEAIYNLKSYLVVLIVAIFGSTPLIKKLCLKLKRKEKANRFINILESIILVGLFILITAYLVDGSFNPFLYFRF